MKKVKQDEYKAELQSLATILKITLSQAAQYVLKNVHRFDTTPNGFVRYCELVVINHGVDHVDTPAS